MYTIFIYLIYLTLFFIVSVQMWVLVLCFLFIFPGFSVSEFMYHIRFVELVLVDET